MKTHGSLIALVTLGVLCLLPCGALPILAQETAEDLYQAGIYQEEVQGNLERAIEIYEQILTDYPDERSVGARALMHIGLCHEKLGSQEAQRAYSRVLREYADQVAVAERARARLASLQGLARVSDPVETAAIRAITVRTLSSGSPGDVDPSGGPSQDGRFLAYVDWEMMGTNIAVRDLLTGESRRLTDLGSFENGMALAASFSPDGETIAYWWLTAAEVGEVHLAFMDGSKPRVLCSDPDYFYTFGPWDRDGARLLVFRRRADGPLERGWVTVEGGGFSLVDTLTGNGAQLGSESLSPDGRFLAFNYPVSEDSDRRDISMIPIAGGAEIPIVQHPANDRVVGWMPGTSEFLFVSDRGGTEDLYTIEVTDGVVRGPPRVVRRDVGQIAPMGFTAAGELFYWIYTLRMFINVAPFDSETGAVYAESAVPLLGAKAHPAWSPDGSGLTYWHKKDRPSWPSDWDQVLGVTDLVTGKERELAADLEVEVPKWSLDGRSIVALALERDKKESDAPAFFMIDRDTGERSELIRFAPKRNWYWHIGAVQAPNGRDVVYVREGRLVLHEVSTRKETELYRHPGLARILLPSRDGRTLLFAVTDPAVSYIQMGTPNRVEGAGKLMLVRLPEGRIDELLAVDLQPGTKIETVDWGPEGRYVYFTVTEGGERTILKRAPLGGGEAETVWESEMPVRGLTISPNGERVAFAVGENQADIYVMENLGEALKELRDRR